MRFLVPGLQRHGAGYARAPAAGPRTCGQQVAAGQQAQAAHARAVAEQVVLPRPPAVGGLRAQLAAVARLPGHAGCQRARPGPALLVEGAPYLARVSGSSVSSSPALLRHTRCLMSTVQHGRHSSWCQTHARRGEQQREARWNIAAQASTVIRLLTSFQHTEAAGREGYSRHGRSCQTCAENWMGCETQHSTVSCLRRVAVSVCLHQGRHIQPRQTQARNKAARKRTE